MTYTFVVQNMGNRSVELTDNAQINDTFDPILNDISVAINGTTIDNTTGYSYNTATGAFSTNQGALAVPAATFTRDSATGVVTVTPGVTVLTVSGRVQ